MRVIYLENEHAYKKEVKNKAAFAHVSAPEVYPAVFAHHKDVHSYFYFEKDLVEEMTLKRFINFYLQEILLKFEHLFK